jgi:hypothetical protein
MIAYIFAAVAWVIAFAFYLLNRKALRLIREQRATIDATLAAHKDANRAFAVHADMLVQSRQATIDTQRDMLIAARRALYEIHSTITRRPPRRRWLRIAHKVALAAERGTAHHVTH